MRVFYIEDGGSDLAVYDIARMSPAQWHPLTDNTARFGLSDSTFWLKVSLTNHSEYPRTRLLEFGSATQDYIEVFSELAGHHSMGDRVPFSQRPLQSVTPTIELTLAPHGSSDVWVRLDTASGFFEWIPVRLHTKEEWAQTQLAQNFLLGMFFGSLAIMLVYGLTLSMVLKNINFITYSAYLSAALICTFVYYGFGFRWLWPSWPTLNFWALQISYTGLILTSALFAERFLNIRQHYPVLHRLLQLLSGLLLVAMLLTLTGVPRATMAMLVPLSMLILALLSGCAAVTAWRLPGWTSLLFLLAWPSLLICIGLSFANALNWVPIALDTKYLLSGLFTVEMQLLGILISRQFYRLRNDLLSARSDTSRQTNLEVMARNRELEVLNQKLKEQAYRDPMTGLRNRRSFRYALDKLEIEVSGQARALVLIDLDHFKSINDRFGHQVGDKALKHAAGIIDRAVSLVHGQCFRVGGEEFAAMLTAPDQPGLAAQCEMIRLRLAQAPLTLTSGSLPITASIGIKMVDPGQFESSRQIYQQADAALYRAKRLGRNRVCEAGIGSEFSDTPLPA
ncbi:GGDEF domain-containing protein [Ferrimonas sediminicola]|uniref:diguanylate cyclase n=1 Tax=Ferrimonas sediminicola TaxID=2569538 RepID=A0A4U1BB90_9GAMM|nr:diguanylate cyclase [Ferrimonas sediminicola]TKB48184.1 GGDEF domain-containing protein [Ferrimonas sediminicola]